MLSPRPTSHDAKSSRPESPTFQPQLAEHNTPMTKSYSQRTTELTDDTLLESLNDAFADDSLTQEALDADDFTLDNDNIDDFDIKAQQRSSADIPRRRPRYSRMARTTEKPRASILARIVYAVITAVVYGLVGMLLDIIVAIGRSLFILGADHSVFWLFSPFAFVIGAMIGTFAMCLTDVDSNTSYRNGRIRLPYLDPKVLQQDINRGLIKGTVLLAVIALAYTALK